MSDGTEQRQGMNEKTWGEQVGGEFYSRANGEGEKEKVRGRADGPRLDWKRNSGGWKQGRFCGAATATARGDKWESNMALQMALVTEPFAT